MSTKPTEKTTTHYIDDGTDYVRVDVVSYDGQTVGFPKSISRAMCATRLMDGSETMRSHYLASPEVIRAIRAVWTRHESAGERQAVEEWLKTAEDYNADRFRA